MKHLALIVRTLGAWLITLLLVFPLIWLCITAFKTELQAIAVPPELFFSPTLENFVEVQARSDYMHASVSVLRNRPVENVLS